MTTMTYERTEIKMRNPQIAKKQSKRLNSPLTPCSLFLLFSFLNGSSVSDAFSPQGAIFQARLVTIPASTISTSPYRKEICSKFGPLSSSNENNDRDEELSSPSSSKVNSNQSDTIKSAGDGTVRRSNKRVKPAQASKRKMLGFAIPALGIFLSNPLLSNIDNAFVGKTVGTQGLAALSPATICTDQVLYLFSFLGRATTALVARSYAANEDDGTGNTEAARETASAPLSVALFFGTIVTIIYALFTPNMLSALSVNDSLRGPASAYIRWRGAIAWAALAQNVVLNILLATRDAMTPLKIVMLAAAVNIVADAALCVWPLRMGCAGAAAATAFATLFSSGFMMRSLYKKGLLPRIRIPTKQQIGALMEFTGPLLAITLTRLIGAVNMQKAASILGVKPLAAYQMSINLMFLFMLFGEPLSQLSQTQLPALVDSEEPNGPVIRATLKSILNLAGMAALGIGGIAGLTLGFGSSMFSSDVAVQSLARGVSPALFMAVATGIFTVAVDGAMLASRDFSFMLFQGTLSTVGQWWYLKSAYCTTVSAVFGTFTLRLGSYAAIALIRVALGRGPLGRALRRGSAEEQKINGATGVITSY